MSKKFATTQTFEVRPSSWLIDWLVVIHGIAVFAALLNTLIYSYQLMIICSIMISLILHIRTAKNSLFIYYSTLSGWKIAYNTNEYDAISILSTTVITRYFIVLHFYKQNNKKRTILICKDALKNDEFRKLIVALKISGIQR